MNKDNETPERYHIYDSLTPVEHEMLDVPYETETKIRCGTTWEMIGFFNKDKNVIDKYCNLYDVTYKQLLKWKDHWFNLYRQNQVRLGEAVVIEFNTHSMVSIPPLYVYYQFSDGNGMIYPMMECDYDQEKEEYDIPDSLQKFLSKDKILDYMKRRKCSDRSDSKWKSEQTTYELCIKSGDKSIDVCGNIFELKRFEELVRMLSDVSSVIRDISREKKNQKDYGEQLSGIERFFSQSGVKDLTIEDFWRYTYNNIWFQTGEIAEFLVAKALDDPSVYSRNSEYWAAWDLNYKNMKIEVKATADFHSWNSDRRETQRTFDIHKVKNRGYVDTKDEMCRASQVYVFCHNKCEGEYKARNSYPLNLSNWDFYIIPTHIIDEKCKDNKSIALQRVIKLHQRSPYKFEEIKGAVDEIYNELNDKGEIKPTSGIDTNKKKEAPMERLFKMVIALHRKGYQKIRLCIARSSDSTMKCWVTSKSNCSKYCGVMPFKTTEPETAYFESGMAEWVNEKMNYHNMADAFIERFPEIMRMGKGVDPDYVAWHKTAFRACCEGNIFYTIDDSSNCFSKGYIMLTGLNFRGLPFPTPGESEGCGIY